MEEVLNCIVTILNAWAIFVCFFAVVYACLVFYKLSAPLEHFVFSSHELKEMTTDKLLKIEKKTIRKFYKLEKQVIRWQDKKEVKGDGSIFDGVFYVDRKLTLKKLEIADTNLDRIRNEIIRRQAF